MEWLNVPGGTRTLPPGAFTSTSGGGVECDAPIAVALRRVRADRFSLQKAFYAVSCCPVL
jgi:hypothetical protein